MSRFEEKEVIQAILVADNNVDNLQPLTSVTSPALLPLVNVPMLDYALEGLNRSGVEEVFVYAGLHLNKVREHIRQGKERMHTWSLNMTVHVIGGESCRCFGDAMRDLDAKGLIRSNFILLGADTVTNADLRPIYEEHKKMAKYDKGAAATLVFKEASSPVRTGNEVMIAMDAQNNRLHFHQRLHMNTKESYFDVPLEVFVNNSKVALKHNLLDPQIAIGSPTMLSLFSDNFDFQTRDDFVRGLLINEEILDSRIYVSFLPRGQYARKVNNWLAYQIVTQDVINRWAYPLVPDMSICCLSQQYVFVKNNIYKSPKALVQKSTLQENVVIQAQSKVEEGSQVSFSVIGANCKIGRNCRLVHAYLMDNVVIGNDCVLEYCVVGPNARIGEQCVVSQGSVVGEGCQIPANTQLTKNFVKSSKDNDYEVDVLKQLSDKAFIVNLESDAADAAPSQDSDSEYDRDVRGPTSIPKMLALPTTLEDSDYSVSSGDEEESQCAASPVPDDANIFLSEVMDSLARGFQEKSNPDFLILEINSSRYAYNMTLKEVNFYVAKAIFSLQPIKQPLKDDAKKAVEIVLKQLGAVLSNYIKHEDAMLDCLKALQEAAGENEYLMRRLPNIVHHLYDEDFVTEDAILSWHATLDDDEVKASLTKLIEWFEQSSEDE